MLRSRIHANDSTSSSGLDMKCMTVDELFDEMRKENPSFDDELEEGRKFFAKKKEEMGDEKFRNWMLEPLIPVEEFLSDDNYGV